jgi:sugar O-acyltransferase (sialic acid O-acetyltransferase NeuD family)
VEKTRGLVIVGDSAFAEIAFEYFSADTGYEVRAFCVERPYLKRDSLLGRPVVPFETLEDEYSARDHDVFVAITYTQLNRVRARLCQAAKAKGFALASYVSPRAFVWRNVRLGEHCFVFEGNVLQPFVTVGSNVIFWSGNHIGHHSTIQDHCFVSSHVVLSGFVHVGEYCFLGVNATVTQNVTIARDCWIGPHVLVTRDTREGQLYKRGATVTPEPLGARSFFGVPE